MGHTCWCLGPFPALCSRDHEAQTRQVPYPLHCLWPSSLLPAGSLLNSQHLEQRLQYSRRFMSIAGNMTIMSIRTSFVFSHTHLYEHVFAGSAVLASTKSYSSVLLPLPCCSCCCSVLAWVHAWLWSGYIEPCSLWW